MPTSIIDENEPMHSTNKLSRFEGFLASDPDNESLRLEVFELALALGKYEQAEQHVMAAIKQHGNPSGWRFRLASLRMAQNRLDEARETLGELQAEVGAQHMIAHNLAIIAFMNKDYQSCSDTLSLWVSPQQSTSGNIEHLVERLPLESLSALQTLWLRSLHRLGQLERAWTWIVNQRTRNVLTAAAAGVASLIAADSDHLEHVEELARLAKGDPDSRQEVYLSLSTFFLFKQDRVGARHQLEQALAVNSSAGRVWSTLGFVDLQDQLADKAVEDFERAVQLMPEHVGTWIGLGWARLLAHKERTGTHQAFQTALELDHNFAESHGCLAVVLAAAGKRLEAQHHIELADRLDRANMAARYAEAVLNGDAADVRAIQRLARRLLSKAN